MMDHMVHNADHSLGKQPGIVRLSVARRDRRAALHGYAGKCTRSWRPGGPETRGTTVCCIRSKSSRLAIHPFRDVNTRSQHVFFNQLARDAGWVIDWSQIPGDVFAHARTLAIVEDHSGLDALIRPNLVTVEDAARSDRLTASLDGHAQGFTTRRSVRDPETLDRALDAARQRRWNLQPPEAFGGASPCDPRSGPSLGL